MPYSNPTLGNPNGTPTTGNDTYAPASLLGLLNIADGNDSSGDALAGNDTLIGGNGSDTLNGGDGNDLIIGGSGSTLAADASLLGIAQVNVGLDLSLLSASGDSNDSLIGGAGNDTMFGDAGNDTLLGGAGDDVLDGGAGIDSMVGGAGNDLYLTDNPSDVVVEAANEGIDTVNTTASNYTLGANVENLTFVGTGTITGNGNELNNVITGNGTSNYLSGLAGADTLVGGAGNDTLDGGTGDDSMAGGSGNDTYYTDSAFDLVTEAAGEGTDTVVTTANLTTLTANVENLTFAGSGNFIGTGNDQDNTITGGSGNDRLDGGAGNDTLIGSGGSDTLDGGAGADSMVGGSSGDVYVVDNVGDVVVEQDNSGTDLVNTTLNTYTLGNYLENLTFTGTGNFIGNGNALDNVITGGSGNDTINGGLGNDTISGGGGSDSLIGGGGTDTVQFANAFATYSFTVNDATNSATVAGNGATTTTQGFTNYVFSDRTVTFANLPCYVTGTRIETTRGLVTVEDLRAGDVVRTVSGRHGDWAPVKWIGFRQVDLLRHPQPAKVQPVRFLAGSLGEGLPVRDLVVSPDHCMWIDGALVPAHLLINGDSIVQETARATVTYWHVELEQHDVLVAEGAASESYLDTGNRHAFTNGGAAEMLHADFEGSDSADRLVPRLPADGGEVVQAIRARLNGAVPALAA
ncbi:Hint domain-containing protein [Roseomonas elaeocarpi]|uniref:Hint domain-containing protein n=1 Tax=Roseomonas elaeocarpi TaxID=907779 RepID=A0ABV6JUS0_9PROT